MLYIEVKEELVNHSLYKWYTVYIKIPSHFFIPQKMGISFFFFFF